MSAATRQRAQERGAEQLADLIEQVVETRGALPGPSTRQ